METKIEVKCEREGTGFIAVADNGGEGVEHIECGQHHAALQDAPSVDELLAHIGKQTGISRPTPGPVAQRSSTKRNVAAGFR